jgi:4-amino-4-deoxy-L-arabinose transferase-like glycosyltransferase
MPKQLFPGLVVAMMAAVVLFPNLGGPPLWDEDEPRNASCSLAMRHSGDWVVPTFNGRLRVEKPALVNWVHLAGFAVAGPNETGARLGSALLTLGTCLLTWQIGTLLFGPEVGMWAGIVLATCLWTGVTGRAATPDAPLAFFTTLALWLFVRGASDSRGRLPDAPVRLPLGVALGIGGVCGLAVLTKGPIGLVLPVVALGGFACWQAVIDPGRQGTWLERLPSATASAWRGIRPLVITAAAGSVAVPWYALVTVRTDGAWLREFLLVHNLGRFAAPMEGHSGSAILYYPLVLLVGLFPWSMASGLIGRHALVTVGQQGETAAGMRLMAAWIAAWLIPFSLAGTKLPGYIWPAYPAVACGIALFIADWIRSPSRSTDGWMRWAWGFLIVSGIGLAIGLSWATHRLAPGGEWIGLVGLLPLVGGLLASRFQTHSSRLAASGCWAATAWGTVALLMAVGPVSLGRSGGARHLLARLPAGGIPQPIASYRAPASTSFYASLIAAEGRVAELENPAEVVAFVAAHPGAPLVVDARFEDQVAAELPARYQVLRAVTVLPESRELVLFGPTDPVTSHATEPATIADADADASIISLHR